MCIQSSETLEMSPKNQEASEARDPQEGGPENAPGEHRSRTSKAGGAKKNEET